MKLSSDDVVGAANAYRLALRYVDDAEIRAVYEPLNIQAKAKMADAYFKQARYEQTQVE